MVVTPASFVVRVLAPVVRTRGVGSNGEDHDDCDGDG